MLSYSFYCINDQWVDVERLEELFAEATLEEIISEVERGTLYVFLYPTLRQFKVGISKERVHSRLTEVNREFLNHGLYCADSFVLMTRDVVNYKQKEKALHAMFASCRFGKGRPPHPTGLTELFDLDDDNGELNWKLIGLLEHVSGHSIRELFAEKVQQVDNQLPPQDPIAEQVSEDALGNHDVVEEPYASAQESDKEEKRIALLQEENEERHYKNWEQLNKKHEERSSNAIGTFLTVAGVCSGAVVLGAIEVTLAPLFVAVVGTACALNSLYDKN
jgi:hypothetical protein